MGKAKSAGGGAVDLFRAEEEARRARVEAGRKPVALAAAPALQVTHEPVYQIPRTWLRPLEHNGAPVNPRRHFDPVKLQELADSMKGVGIQQPLVVRLPAIIEGYRDPERWTEELHPVLDIVAGERRWRAAELAGVDLVPCYLRPLSIEEAVDVCIVENDQRSDLTAVERARGYRAWLDLVDGRTQDQLAQRIGVSQGQISNQIRLLQLPSDVLELIDAGVLQATHARDVLLPFVQLREPFRGELLQEVVGTLQTWVANGSALGASGVRQAVKDAACKRSNSLDRWSCGFDPELHRECGCGGPSFTYDWGDNRTVRCFDREWWNAQKQAAAAADEQKRREAIEAIAANGNDESIPVVAATDLSGPLLRASQVTLAHGGKMGTWGMFDPRKLPKADTVWVRERGGEYSLVCTNPKAAQQAQTAATREMNKRVGARRRQQLDWLRAEARTTAWEPRMTGFLLDLTSTYSGELVTAAAKELGITAPTYSPGRWSGLAESDQVTLGVYLALQREGQALMEREEKRIREELRAELSAFMPTPPVETSMAAAEEPREPTGRAGLPSKWPAAELRTPEARLALRMLHIREANDLAELAIEADDSEALDRADRTLLRRIERLARHCFAAGVMPSEEDVAFLDELAGGSLDTVSFAERLEEISAAAQAEARTRCVYCGLPEDEAGPLLTAGDAFPDLAGALLCAGCNPDPSVRYPLAPGEARCRVCGCTDNRGCIEGCTWVEVDREAKTGLCSNPLCVATAAETAAAEAVPLPEPTIRPWFLGSAPGFEYVGSNALGEFVYRRRVLHETRDMWETVSGQVKRGGCGRSLIPYDGPADAPQWAKSVRDLYIDGDPIKGYANEAGATPRDEPPLNAKEIGWNAPRMPAAKKRAPARSGSSSSREVTR